MHPFEEYLQQHTLEALMVSINANVRYTTVYNALKGFPVTPDHAQKIRQAVLRMTGTTYTGPFTLTEPKSDEDIPTIPVRNFPRHKLH